MRRMLLALAAGTAVSAILLWWSLRDVDGAAVLDALRSAEARWLAVFAAATAAGACLRGARWRMVADGTAEQQHRFLQATFLGVLGNYLLPGRAGEVVRVGTLARLLHWPLARPLVSALLDRCLDLAVLATAGALLVVAWPGSTALSRGLIGLAVAAGALLLLLVWFARARLPAEALLLQWVQRAGSRYGLDARAAVGPVRTELRALVSRLASPAAWRIFAGVALVAVADYVALSALLRAFGLELPAAAPILLWVALALGSSIPSAPGYVGVYQAACAWVLAQYSVPGATAIALATSLQILTLSVAIVLVACNSPVQLLRRMARKG